MNLSPYFSPVSFFFSHCYVRSSILCAPLSAQSSFYKYIDKNGKVTFTDRLEAIS